MGLVRRLQTESKGLGPIAAAEEVDQMQLARDEMKKLKAATKAEKAEKAENTAEARRARQDARIQSESSPAAPPTPAARSAKRTGPVRRRQQTLQESFPTPAVAASTTATDANTADASTADTSIADTSATDASVGVFELTIRRARQPSIKLALEVEDTILDVKCKIEDKDGIPRDQQRLKLGAIPLQDDDLAKSCIDGASAVWLCLAK